MSPRRVVLLVNPHPDDGEAFAAQLCAQAMHLDWEVHQLLATCDEYGTPDPRFKGHRIQRIRRAEMYRAAAIYSSYFHTSLSLQLHWMNYIDGHVPFSTSSVHRLRRFIEKLHPDIIIGPDPFLYMDAHVDHLAVGKMFYFALRGITKKLRPTLMLFYQTLVPDIFLPQKYPGVIYRARMAHRSQWEPLMGRLLDFFQSLVQLGRRLQYAHLRRVEGYRRLSSFALTDLSEGNNLAKVCGWAKLAYNFFWNRPLGCEPGRLLPHPSSFGLQLDPQSEIE